MRIFPSRLVGDESRVSAIEYCDLVWVNLEEVKKIQTVPIVANRTTKIKASLIDPLSVTHHRV